MDADGMVRVPRERPGIGVDLDTDLIDSLTTRVEVLSATRAMVAVS
jgi:hypothetical protein